MTALLAGRGAFAQTPEEEAPASPLVVSEHESAPAATGTIAPATVPGAEDLAEDDPLADWLNAEGWTLDGVQPPDPIRASPAAGRAEDGVRGQSEPGVTVSLFNDTSRLRLGGNISLVAIAGSQRTFVPWNPLLVLPPSAFGNQTNTFEMHARQTNFNIGFTGPEYEGFTPGAFVKLYMTNSSLTSDTYGLLPVVAFADLKRDDWRFAVGLQPDLFAPRDPQVIPMSLMGGTGNAGTFRGQVRAERYLGPQDEWQGVLQFALSDPVSTILIDSNRRSVEANGWPNIEARLGLGLGPQEALAGNRTERIAEVGVAGVFGQLRNSQLLTTIEDIEANIPVRSEIDVWGLSVDGRLNVTDRWGFVGEGYTGQGLGNYAANVFQTFNSQTFSAVRGSGGFLGGFLYLSDQVVMNAGYGVDAPRRDDLALDGIARNDAWYTSLFWDVTRTVQLGFQVDYRQTDYVALPDNSATVFYTQFLWRF
ncbi:MAG: hypothetical protein ACKOGA_13955 [Planctomycetaceae bacterium]